MVRHNCCCLCCRPTRSHRLARHVRPEDHIHTRTEVQAAPDSRLLVDGRVLSLGKTSAGRSSVETIIELTVLCVPVYHPGPGEDPLNPLSAKENLVRPQEEQAEPAHPHRRENHSPQTLRTHEIRCVFRLEATRVPQYLPGLSAVCKLEKAVGVRPPEELAGTVTRVDRGGRHDGAETERSERIREVCE